jgi:hypothetical protein
MKTTYEVTDGQVNDFMASFCPFGWRDCEAAIQTAYEAGHDSDWAVEQIEDYADSCGVKLADIDPVYCVYDSILQEARNEIDNLCKFDIMNDANFDTYGNYMCTDYQYRDEDKTALIEKLAENDVKIGDLDEATQYFLSSVEISQEEIEAAKPEAE